MRVAAGIALLGLAGCELVFPPGGDDGDDGTGTAWTVVAPADWHTCGVRADDSLWCWGRDHVGQLGLAGSTTDQTEPVRVGEARWRTVAAAGSSTCAIDTDGVLACWGWNAYGQLGDGTTDRRDVPTPITEPGPWDTVGVSHAHTCAVKLDGSLWCWGRNDYQQIAATGNPLPIPVRIEGSWLAVSPGSLHTCAIRADHTMWCWGANYGSQVGGAASDIAPPYQVGLDADWFAVSAGDAHSCGLRGTGVVVCWGDDNYGSLGDGASGGTAPPTPALVGDGFVAIAAGDWHTCALHGDGTAMCWGYNELGQLAVPDVDVRVPVPMPFGGSTRWSSIGVAAYVTCATTVDGTLHCTGANAYGQLGRGTRGNQPSPVEILPGTTWNTVDAGYRHTCATTGEDDFLWCWGVGWFGQLGGNSRQSRQVPGPTFETAIAQVAVGFDHTCAIDTDGRLFCWGRNDDGALGLGNQTTFDAPMMVGGAQWKQVFATRHVCATQANDTLWCWGANDLGQIDPMLGPHFAPIQIGNGVASHVAVGGAHGCAVDLNTAQLWCWGDNSWRQVWDNPASPVAASVQPLGTSIVNAVATGGGHTCVIDAVVRALSCWGKNHLGQLGDGTTTSRGTPAPILPVGPWAAVAAGEDHTCAIDDQDRLWCWGANTFGELGIGSFDPSPTPVEVAPGTGFATVEAGWYHTCAITLDRRLFCWGLNEVGAIGDERSWYDELAAVQP